MKKYTLLLLFFPVFSFAQYKSIKDFGVLPTNQPEVNKTNLQKAIDWATTSGSALWIEPVEGGYPVSSGIRLKKNVSLVGVHGPTGRGTKNPQSNEPVGSLFKITDEDNAFITVESATQIRGIQFWYPEQTYMDPDKIIKYKPTIQVAKEQNVQGVTLSNLTFYGEYIAMDFNSTGRNINEQILFEHCYGYPLSGEFIRIDYCYDIPRILHCHINPANMREFGRTFHKRIVDAVIANGTFSYSINHTDNAQMIDIFTFGVYGGVYLGAETYGQLTNFNLDCVTVGIHKIGGGKKNRNWQIAQGSIIANTGKDIKDIHPLIIEGEGHTAISNVEAFSGHNAALTTVEESYDYMLIKGDKLLTISLFGCRMRNYISDTPFSIQNPNAKVQAVGCIDKNEMFYNLIKD
ncbi:MAG: glycoside hydrolase family 55 protein [Bacteroidales bacterium]|jgi:hypothetical protein|nr:glycoside hydrolase family 55 protein [Bacteroidales bacterium]